MKTLRLEHAKYLRNRKEANVTGAERIRERGRGDEAREAREGQGGQTPYRPYRFGTLL
jgi:hypothetical protein